MERKILATIANNPDLLEVVRELFLEQFNIDGLSAEKDDTLLGQAVRARLVGTKAVEDAMRIIEKYKTNPQSTKQENPAY